LVKTLVNLRAGTVKYSAALALIFSQAAAELNCHDRQSKITATVNEGTGRGRMAFQEPHGPTAVVPTPSK